MTGAAPTVPGPQLRAEDFFRRLRAWPVSSWRHGDRVRATRAAGQALADLAADAENRRRRTVPELAEFGLADQLAVLYRDALAVRPAQAARILDEVAVRLGFR